MTFQILLRGVGLEPEEVAVCLHRAGSEQMNRAIARLAETAPDLFNTYQSTHSANAEATLKRRRVLASFLMRGRGELVFAGLFGVQGWTNVASEVLDADPVQQELQSRTGNWTFVSGRQTERALFDLLPLDLLREFVGRLVVADPGARAHMRLAETTVLRIVEVTPVPRLSPTMPHWNQLVLKADELSDLPADWALRLSEWRGVYLIVDAADGARYVGSAYGVENLYGRWRAHVAGEIGITAQLALRQTGGFRFSILERVSPDLPVDAVTAIEQSWMIRLQTREFGLNA